VGLQVIRTNFAIRLRPRYVRASNSARDVYHRVDKTDRDDDFTAEHAEHAETTLQLQQMGERQRGSALSFPQVVAVAVSVV